ncbi:hypothetical protein EOM39_07180, partial [Candidatus Gracilibacteria bacterium]|nr:hypothetical protein [Candidatus Gracilibacteria bacterium]
NASMIGGDRVNLNISSYMLAKFMYGNGGSEYYDSNHWISQKVKNTDLYKEKVNDLIEKMNVTKSQVIEGEPLFGGDGVGSIPEEFDFGTSFGSIIGTISGVRNNDGTITTTFNNNDSYVFNSKDRLGEPITNPFNIMGKYYQDRGYGTPFNWELNIVETFKY